MKDKEGLFREISENAKPFNTNIVDGGAKNFTARDKVRAFGMHISHGRVILYADAETPDGAPVAQTGEWFTVSSDINPKVVGDRSPQTEALARHMGPPPKTSFLRGIIESHRRKQKIRRLPPGLRPR